MTTGNNILINLNPGVKHPKEVVPKGNFNLRAKVLLENNYTLFWLSLFDVNFGAFNFEVGEV